MRALVMAAGLGTRLRPLTDSLPKPLVPVLGRPMVEYVLDGLAQHGVMEAIININYLPDAMRAFVASWNQAGRMPRLEIQDESARILDTGGAVALAAPWLFRSQEQALVCNADVIAHPDLALLLGVHKALENQGVECTLAVTPHPEAGRKYTGLRKQGSLILGFERAGEPDPGLWHFPGYYLLSARAVGRLPPAGTAFSIVEKLWKPLAASGKLGAWEYHGAYFDLGTVADLQAAERALAKNPSP